jgi:predicted kinase
MSRTVLILVTGLPCTGKSTLANRLARDLGLPLVGRDDIKEVLFDNLGWKDRDWSKKLGIASWHLLYYFVELLLATGQSFVVENYFKSDFDTQKFRQLRARYDFQALQIRCTTDGETLFERFKRRSETGERHRGHTDHQNYAEFEQQLMAGTCDMLDIGGETLDVDTTDLASLDYAALLTAVKRRLPADGDPRSQYPTTSDAH